jgi:hypothetical protein
MDAKMQAALMAYTKHRDYMKAYNRRPEVRAKHTAYNRKRWELIKKAQELLKTEQLSEEA